MAAIGGFRFDLSIPRKIDGNFGSVSGGVLFFSRVSTKTVVSSFKLNKFIALFQHG